MVNSKMIKERLCELRMTQGDLARRLDIAQPTMNQKINNIRPLTLEEAEIAAEALQIPDHLFGVYFWARELRSATDGNLSA
jgi:plasmid maintenance system antidote protein VapI